MRLRIELFVDDLDTSIGFYAALGFAVERREHDYASLRWGDAVIGLGPSPSSREPGRPRLHAGAPRRRGGAGVEIVLEVEDLDAALAAVRAAGHPLADPPQDRPGACATSASPTRTATTSASPRPRRTLGRGALRRARGTAGTVAVLRGAGVRRPHGSPRRAGSKR